MIGPSSKDQKDRVMGIATLLSRCGVAAFGLAMAGNVAMAQESPAGEDAAPSLSVELNALQPSERGCRFTFVATNRLGGELSNVAFELVLFDKAGMVNRITVVDFKDLSQGKTKVRQFDFPSVKCDDLGRVLVNDATECVGDGIDPGACVRHLKAETRTETIFGV